jgi:hypothetical protein
MKSAHVFSIIGGLVLAMVLTHEQHARLGAEMAVLMLVRFGGWAVLGTLWWLLGLLLRRDD